MSTPSESSGRSATAPAEQRSPSEVPSLWRALAPLALCLASVAIIVLAANLL